MNSLLVYNEEYLKGQVKDMPFSYNEVEGLFGTELRWKPLKESPLLGGRQYLFLKDLEAAEKNPRLFSYEEKV